MDKSIRTQRIRNALWGLFIGDALAMPVHWYYNPQNIKTDFDGGVRGFHAPRHPQPESFMVGMGYHPDTANAARLGRPYDILHAHRRFYDTSYGALAIDRTEREGEHGNLTPALKERFHYHHGLTAGENTLGAHLTRVLMRTALARGRYAPRDFLNAFVEHMSTPGRNRDPYTEIYIRRWFENFSQGLPPHACAEQQRNIWSIGSHGGLIRPLVVSLLAPNPYLAMGVAIEHMTLTHRSENGAAALAILLPMMHALARGADPMSTAAAYARQVHLPRITGEELFSLYREHSGPGNIPAGDMWRLHTTLEDTPMDFQRLASEMPQEIFLHQRLATACYPEHGLPMVLYLALKHGFDMEAALLANANAGGDNVHRGMVLGLLMGAAAARVPEHLSAGLADHDALANEIDAFAELAVGGRGI